MCFLDEMGVVPLQCVSRIHCRIDGIFPLCAALRDRAAN